MHSYTHMSTADIQSENHILLPRCPSLYIQTNTPKGRGVFTSATIPQGTILDVCPVLVFEPIENATQITQTQLYHYTYNWSLRNAVNPSTAQNEPRSQQSHRNHDDGAQAHHQPRIRSPTQTEALVLGLGSMFNHRSAGTPSKTDSGSGGVGQNVGWTRDVERENVTYYALREIAEGEELCISYGDRLTFVDADAVAADGSDEEAAEEVLGRIEFDGIVS